jgi:phosphate uptake regulator
VGIEKRKIQLVAGSTYSVSLPKKWVVDNRLDESREVLIEENLEGFLTMVPENLHLPDTKTIFINAKDYKGDLDSVIFTVYYLGSDSLFIHFEEPPTKKIETRIKKVVKYMSGTEMVYESNNNIAIQFYLDKSKVNINQLIYRISLIIEHSLNQLATRPIKIKEMEENEDEVDKLYHLLLKIITISLKDSKVLQSSNIKNVLFIPSYFVIAQKLETINDIIYHLAKYLHENKLQKCRHAEEIAQHGIKELQRCIKHILKDYPTIFRKQDDAFINESEKLFENIKDPEVKEWAHRIFTNLDQLGKEIINISFYRQISPVKKKNN